MKAIQRLTCGLLAVLLACFWLQGLADTQQVSCPTCGGRGNVGGATCALCGGSGSILMSGSRDGRDSANGITGTLPDTSYQNMLIDGDYLSVHLFADGTHSMMYQKLRALNVSTVVHLRSPYSPQTYDTLSAVGTIQSLSELLSRHVNGFQLSLTDRFSEEDYDNARAMFASSADGPLSCLYLMFAQGKRSAFILTQDGVAETREAALAEALCAWLDAASMIIFGLAIGALICFLGGLMAVDIVSKKASGAALGVVGIASYVGAAIQDLISGFLIQSGKAGAGESATYDFSVASWFWIGAAILSVLCTLAVWRARDRT